MIKVDENTWVFPRYKIIKETLEIALESKPVGKFSICNEEGKLIGTYDSFAMAESIVSTTAKGVDVFFKETVSENVRLKEQVEQLRELWSNAITVAEKHCPVTLGESYIKDGIPRLAMLAKQCQESNKLLREENEKLRNDILF